MNEEDTFLTKLSSCIQNGCDFKLLIRVGLTNSTINWCSVCGSILQVGYDGSSTIDHSDLYHYVKKQLES